MIDLRERRKAASMTQQELSRRSGISQQAISAIEGSWRTPSVSTAKRIAAALGFDWTEFFSAEQRDAG